MNILTKICVVILLVLVLFASFTFINMATVPQNWLAAYRQEQARRLLSDQAVRVQKLAAERAIEELKMANTRADQVASELAEIKKDAVPGPEDLRTAALQKTVDTQATLLAELKEGVKAAGERTEALLAQLDTSRQTIADLQKETRRQSGEVVQLRGQLEREQRVVRALQRQLQDRDERVAELERKIVDLVHGVTGEEKGAATPGKIAGTLTAVRGELASINIGTAHGVTRGLKLYIYRDASFVGYLRIDEVDEGEAAGTIVDKQLDPLVGDKVTNDLLK